MSSEERLRRERQVADGREMALTIRRMAGELVELDPQPQEVLLVGIHTRGVPLARRLAAEIETMEGVSPLLGTLDITLYRDDLSTIAPQPVVKGTEFPVSVEGRVVVLADDVLFTGRTVRAALDELADYGRPQAVRLAVLVDRGHRELPIQADVVGRRLATERNQLVEVAFEATDGEDAIRLVEQGDAA